MSSRPVITLTTDFGLADAYVAAMKGVILGIAPHATIVDISHGIPPQDVLAGSFVLQQACRHFPAGTIHLAVVDPGVGGERDAIAIRGDRGLFVGPDNGLLCPALLAQDSIDASGILTAGTGVVLSNEEYWLRPTSQTFHGRDIFAPAAAHLATGVPLERFGPTLQSIKCQRTEIARCSDGIIRGAIVYIDHYGNAVSNIAEDLVAKGAEIVIKDRHLKGLAKCYQDADLVAIAGSMGLIEIACRNASAAHVLQLAVGDVVTVRGRQCG